jgi:predicted phage gp36 major capsid-like protein
MTVEAVLSQEAPEAPGEVWMDDEAVQRAQARVRASADAAVKAWLALKRAREEETDARAEFDREREAAQRRRAFRERVRKVGGFTVRPTFEPRSPSCTPPHPRAV